MITIDLKDAKKLSKDIKQCVDRAEYWKKNKIKLIAHWGKKYPKGFLLETKVSTPGENEEES